jgi:uncharacterized protein DUF5655
VVAGSRLRSVRRRGDDGRRNLATARLPARSRLAPTQDGAGLTASIYNSRMAGRECHHCKQWIEDGDAHDCWTTTETALTEDLSEELKDAWERLRETAVAFGDQRIYASGTAIMFSRQSCYFFVRPKRSYLQVCVFLGRAVRSPLVRRIEQKSLTKLVHIIHIKHRDEVEPPITDWLKEAYTLRVLQSSTSCRRLSTPHRTRA